MPGQSTNANPGAEKLSFNGERVLVTGAGGFIGSHLCEALAAAGARVRALVHYSSLGETGHLGLVPPAIADSFEVIRSNIEDTEAMQRAVEGCAVVFHLAALPGIPYSYHAPRSYLQTNITGTMNLLEAARAHRIRRFVFCSSSEVYGSARTAAIAEDHPLQAQSPYSASKIAGEKLTESYHCSFEVPAVIVRPFNTFGPRQSTRAIIPTIITQALYAPEIALGNLTTTRDLTYVTDTCEGLWRAGLLPEIDGLACNLGVGERIAIGDLARMILAQMGIDKPIVSRPQRLRPVASEVQDLQSDNRLARTRLGWQPLVRLSDGLARTIEFFQAQPRPARVQDYAI